MEKTIEMISGKITQIESVINRNFTVINNNFEEHMKAINDAFKAVKKQRTFNKLVIVAGIYGAYKIHKQNEELQALKAKNEEQEIAEE